MVGVRLRILVQYAGSTKLCEAQKQGGDELRRCSTMGLRVGGGASLERFWQRRL